MKGFFLYVDVLALVILEFDVRDIYFKENVNLSDV